MSKILSIDPGIANTGIAIVQRKAQAYKLIKTRLVQTKPTEAEPARLLQIYNTVKEALETEDITAVAIEKVFHNRNITSSITTGKVIGILSLAAAQHNLPVIFLTPQQIKACSGVGTQAGKKDMLRMASRIFKTPLKNHHQADAALTGLAGLLLQNGENKNAKAQRK